MALCSDTRGAGAPAAAAASRFLKRSTTMNSIFVCQSTAGRRPVSGARPPVTVLEPDDVVELGRGHLEDVGVLEGDHAVAQAGRHVERLARTELDPPRRLPLAEVLERQAPGH